MCILFSHIRNTQSKAQISKCNNKSCLFQYTGFTVSKSQSHKEIVYISSTSKSRNLIYFYFVKK